MSDFKVPSLPNVSAKIVKSNTNEESDGPVKPNAEVNNDAAVPCPYKMPPWSATPPAQMHYKFEVLKSGQIIDEIESLERQASWKFGRLPQNDVVMAHPTISRFHAVLQYRPKSPSEEQNEGEGNAAEPPEGWYVYDLESTHGTFLNKQRLPSRVFIRMRVGHMLKLGTSSRTYILQGPVDDEEPESELSVTELREQRKIKEAQIVAEAERKAEDARERERNEGISWGMSEDADEETDLTHNPYASTNNEELFLDDPKKTLRGYFEREDMPLEYKCDEMSTGCFVCRVELPIDDANGRPLVAEVVHKGRKKDCVIQCALEACRILDRYGVLRQSHQEPSRRKVKNKDSDSDDDEFWDRTGAVERKRQRKENSAATKALTYEDLLKKQTDLNAELKTVSTEIIMYKEKEKRIKSTNVESDDLDSFMENLTDDSKTSLDKTEIRKLRMEQQRIEAEIEKVKRLLKIAAPTILPISGNMTSAANKEITDKAKPTNKQMPMIGKRNQFSKFVILKKPQIKIEKLETKIKSDEEEIEQYEEAAQETDTTLINAHITKNEEPTSVSEEKKLIKFYGPASIHSDILKKEATPIKTVDADFEQTPISTDAVPDESGNAKKRRNRQRQRNKRQEVDIEELDEHESNEKYAKWVPPENQTGDGYTNLNAKYGY